MNWIERNPARFEAEVEAMNDRFPQFRLLELEGDYFWFGEVETNLGNRYLFSVGYPENYPMVPPEVEVVEPELKPCPHIRQGNVFPRSLCLFADSRFFDPDRTTAVTVLGRACVWLMCYETYLQTGHWPGPAH